MANLFYSLPTEITREIYDFDPTYKEKLDMSLRLIEHGMEKCTCGGKIATVTAPFFYRARYGNSFCIKHDLRPLLNSSNEYDEEPVDFVTEYGNFSAESFNEFQTLLQSGESFTFNNNGHEISIEFKTIAQYEREQIIPNIFWILLCLYWDLYIPQKSIKIINNKKRRQGRFMDMGHYQRSEV